MNMNNLNFADLLFIQYLLITSHNLSIHPDKTIDLESFRKEYPDVYVVCKKLEELNSKYIIRLEDKSNLRFKSINIILEVSQFVSSKYVLRINFNKSKVEAVIHSIDSTLPIFYSINLTQTNINGFFDLIPNIIEVLDKLTISYYKTNQTKTFTDLQSLLINITRKLNKKVNTEEIKKWVNLKLMFIYL